MIPFEVVYLVFLSLSFSLGQMQSDYTTFASIYLAHFQS